jgi:Ser/Thr protein kinase RdoA (MazF antagonist)
MLEQTIRAVLSHYALDWGGVRGLAAEPISGGWSGSQIWRVTASSGEQFCLRQWPREHPSIERLQMIHGVLLTVAPELPVVAFPLRTTAGPTFVEHARHLWEVTTWRPGAADFHANPSRPRLRAVMRTLAGFHLWASGCGRRYGAAPAVTDRIELLETMQDRGWQAIQHSIVLPLGNEVDQPATRLWNLLKPVEQWNPLSGHLAAVTELAIQPTIRDIHHDHVLFTGDEVTGIIDFGALRMDTPLTDIARLIGSLVEDNSELREAAIKAYGELRPLNEADRWIIDLLDRSGFFIGAMNWLTWLYVDRREMGPGAPIVRRLNQFIGRLEEQRRIGWI